jgi:hypothetical protein
MSQVLFDDLEILKWGKETETNPSSFRVRRTTVSSHGVAEKVFRHGQAKEDGDADDKEVAHGVHVSEL